MSNSEPVPFGGLLLRYRAAARLTQEQLASRACLSPDTIAALERGRRLAPHADTVACLADALGLDERERAQLVAAAHGSGNTGITRAIGRRRDVAAAEPGEDTASALREAARARHRLSWRLIGQPTPLVDRAQELQEIVRRLQDEGVRLLTLVGPAGVGKTRLALAAAAQVSQDSERFPDGVALVDLTPVRDPDLVLGAIARALGLLDVGGRTVLERLVDALAERQQLVVLDNVEHVLATAAPLLADLLEALPQLTLLVTSRIPLQLRAEQTLRIAPLPVPDPAVPLPPLEKLLTIPSIALFAQRARAHQATFAVGERQASDVARLVAQLDGLPLALELAAARTATLSLPVIASRLDDRLRLLHWEAADVPERQWSLEAAVGWSYDLLAEPEQWLFRCLGVFAGRVTLDAIAAVAGALAEAAGGRSAGQEGRALDGLVALAEQSLILPMPAATVDWQQGDTEDAADDEDTAEPAFGMLETVREYARERLAAAGELAVAHRAHAHYFLALAERAELPLRGPDQRAWYFRLEREYDNLRVALRWLLNQGEQDRPDAAADREAGLRLAGTLGWFWILRGYHAEGRRWLEEALARAPQAEVPVRTRALLRAGLLLTAQAEYAQAREVLEEALALAEQQQNPYATAEALANLGFRAVFAGEIADATCLLNEARCRWEVLGDAWNLGRTRLDLGVAANMTEDMAGATAHYTAALQWLDSAGDAQFAGTIHSYFGLLSWKLGDFSSAIAHVREAVQTGNSLRDRYLLSISVQAAVALVEACGEPEARARLCGAADALAQAIGARFVWEHMPVGQGMAGLRHRLEQEGWGEAYREGHALPFREVAALALRLLEEVAQQAATPDGAQSPATPSQPSDRSPLSAREQEVLRLVAQGRSSKAIGRQLFLSQSTVNHHLKSVFNKFGVDTRAQAVAVAAQRGLL